MARIHPVLVVSRDLAAQDQYVLFLRRRRVAALGVTTCGDAVSMCRHVRLAAIVVDIASPEDWDACRLIRRVSGSALIAVAGSRDLRGRDLDTLARDSGCTAAVARHRGLPAVAETLDRVLTRELVS
jgi:hypothetical protein